VVDMDKDVAESYRRSVENLIDVQNRELPICPRDGEPCLTPEMGCQTTYFGSMASDGVEETAFSCPRAVKAGKK
jgi:hypothetical protein